MIFRLVEFNAAPYQLVIGILYFNYRRIIFNKKYLLNNIQTLSKYLLNSGYLGSSMIGALLIFCGFQVNASKYASIVLGVMLLVLLYWARNWLTRFLTVLFVGIIVGLWFLKNGEGLKYFVLFVGYVYSFFFFSFKRKGFDFSLTNNFFYFPVSVMSCLYSVWDILDDLGNPRISIDALSKLHHNYYFS